MLSNTLPSKTNEALIAFSESNQDILSLTKSLNRQRKLQEAIDSPISESEQKAIKDEVINSLSKAEANLGLANTNQIRESIREHFNGVSKNDLAERLTTLTPVFDFLDSTFRLNKESQKLVKDPELKSEIENKSRGLMQVSYETVENLPELIKSEQKTNKGHHRILDRDLGPAITTSEFFKKNISTHFHKLNQKLELMDNPEQTEKTQKLLDKFYRLLDNFIIAPKKETFKDLFNFRYYPVLGNKVQTNQEKQINQFTKLADEIDFNGLQNAIRQTAKLSDKALKGDDYTNLKNFVKKEAARIEECSALYKANEQAILSKIRDSLDLAKPSVLTFLNRVDLDRLVKEHPSIKESAEKASRNNLMLTSLKITVDRIDHSGEYLRKAEQGMDVKGSAGRRRHGRTGSRAS